MGELRDRMQQDLTLCGLSPSTHEAYLRQARFFIAYFRRPVSELGTEHVRTWILHLLTVLGRSPATVNQAIAGLRLLFGPTLKRPERVSELVKLSVSDIDSKRMVIIVRDTKTRHDRLAPLTPRMLEALRAYWRARRPSGPYLFESRRAGEPLTRIAVAVALRKTASRAGLGKHFYPHLLRHAFATHMLELGADVRSVQVLLGHVSIRSTARYLLLTEARRSTLNNLLEAFLRHSYALTPDQHAVLRDLERCRTAALGGHMHVCDSCGYAVPMYNSCRNRHCPTCQSLEQHKWLERRRETILPVPYFHLVFTLPSELRPITRMSPERVFALMFQAASQTVLLASQDKKRLGGTPALTMVLHTWTRELTFHSHVHAIVSAGALSPDGVWLQSRPDYLSPVKVMARLFRRLFREALLEAIDAGQLSVVAESRRRCDAPCARPSGTSTPKRRSEALTRSTAISVATPIALASPTHTSCAPTSTPSPSRPRTAVPAP
jgi:Phage integrase family/Transposase zinc-binding domain/Putative transposase/Phage integrase, N-terminal SAM-like domain